eukprot:s4082_g8.t1
MESNVQIVSGGKLDKLRSMKDIEPYSPINVELYGMLNKIPVLTILVVFLTMAHFHCGFCLHKFYRVKVWVKHCLVMKKIPQRKLERKIEETQQEVENQKASLELQKTECLQEIDRQEADRDCIVDAKDQTITEREEQLGGYQELAHATDMIRNMQMAINQYTTRSEVFSPM